MITPARIASLPSYVLLLRASCTFVAYERAALATWRTCNAITPSITP